MGIHFPKNKKITMSRDNCKEMSNWATEYGKPVRQRTARQETTKKKAGTLPLYVYRRPIPIREDTTLVDSIQAAQGQIDEYDSDSDASDMEEHSMEEIHPTNQSSDEASTVCSSDDE